MLPNPPSWAGGLSVTEVATALVLLSFAAGLSVVSVSMTTFSCMPPRLLTSLALRRPRIAGPPFSPGLSTATKLARTLLTGLLPLENSEGFGERPRLGGEVDWSLALFSNMARRFLTPLFPADMAAVDRGKKKN